MEAISENRWQVRPTHAYALRRLAESWPAARKWTFEFFEREFGDRSVSVANTPDLRLADASGSRFERVSMPLSLYLNRFMGARRDARSEYFYLTKCDLFSEDLGLADDCRFPAVPSSYRSERYLWFSPLGAITPAHWDLPENLHVVLRGKKRFRLYAPTRNLYPHSALTAIHHISRVDILQPDHHLYSRFPRQPDLDLVLDAGDGVVIPSGWWHHVETLESSISVNYWWMPAWRPWLPRVLLQRLGTYAAIKMRTHLPRTRRSG